MDLNELKNCPTRKLLFLCSKNKIPVSLNPTREELLLALNSFFHVKTPEKIPSTHQQTNNNFETPTSVTGQSIPTPLIVHRSFKSPRSINRTYSPRSDNIKSSPNAHKHNTFPNLAFFIIFFIIILTLLLVFVH